LPDSFVGRGYPDLYSIYDKFRKFNKRNNGGDYLLNCEFVPGYFPASAPPNLKNKSFSVVSLDADLYKPIKPTPSF